jgi:mannose-6-phosphate isomerase-like protein (cupin superfamily)
VSSFGLVELLRRQSESGRVYLEFLREGSMSLGLYVLPAGSTDGQSPHTEDEVYVVLAGSGWFTAGEEQRPVGPGDVLFVPAGLPHRFHDIAGDLHLVVVFAPPEGSLAVSG